MESTTPGAIDPPGNVLLVHSKHHEPEMCRELCHHDGEAILTVAFADERIERPYPAADETLGFLVIGDVLTAGTDEFDATESIVTDSIADPTNISEIGIAISRFCKHWDDNGEEIAVCFDSLDALLRHTAPKTVFEFTHVLTKRFSSVDATAHFHFDPTHHEDRVVSTFATIFDDVIADEETTDTLPEATDDEVASLLAEWDQQSSPAADRSQESVSEATDEDIATLLDE